MAHGVRGVVEIEIGGATRTLVCDMNAADVLFQQHGEEWQEWLASHFLGERQERDGVLSRVLPPLSPSDTVKTLYALLATDRLDGSGTESLGDLHTSLGVAEFPRIQTAVLACVLASFGVPGEFIEAAMKAAGAPRETRAAAAGTGAKP